MAARSVGGVAWLVVVLLGGCAVTAPPAEAPPTAAEFEQMRDVLATNPEARTAIEAQCRIDVEGKPEDERAMLGALLDLDADRVPDIFCRRALAGITRGDVSYADFVAMTEGSEDPNVLRRFIRALRLDPSAVAI
jgi:hypothetical protein